MIFKLIFLFLFSTTAFAKDFRYILIPSKADLILKHIPELAVIHKTKDSVIVKATYEQIETLGRDIHELMSKKGGFIDVTLELEKGVSPKELLENEFNVQKSPTNTKKLEIVPSEQIKKLVSEVDADKAWKFMEEFSSFPDRSATTDNGTKAVLFLESRAKDYGSALENFQVRKIETGGYPKQPSVIATYPGNPNSPHVVIGGHMDTLSYNKPGADDDGSGSSVVMEVLRIISKNKLKFDSTIHFVWYGAEERGLVGSSYVVEEFKSKDIKVSAALQFDMTAFKSKKDLEDIYIIDDYTDKGLNDTLIEIVKAYLPHLKIGHTKCDYACSDHASWYRKGYPSTFPFEAGFDNYNHAIHSSGDIMSILDKEHNANFARLAIAAISHYAGLKDF